MNKLICHRANLLGPSNRENELSSIMDCLLNYRYDVEIDVHFIDNILHVGHNLPAKFTITIEDFLKTFSSYKQRLWVHCKNIESIIAFSQLDVKFNFFGHSDDEFVLTSYGHIFTRPNVINQNAIVVMPELIFNDDIINVDHFNCKGILTDYPIKYETYYSAIRA